LIKFSNLDEQTKGELNQIIQQETQIQQILTNAQEQGQQIQQLQAQNQQLAGTNAALKNQQLNVDKSISADMAKEQIKAQDKAADRVFKAGENDKDRALELLKIELDNSTT